MSYSHLMRLDSEQHLPSKEELPALDSPHDSADSLGVSVDPWNKHALRRVDAQTGQQLWSLEFEHPPVAVFAGGGEVGRSLYEEPSWPAKRGSTRSATCPAPASKELVAQNKAKGWTDGSSMTGANRSVQRHLKGIFVRLWSFIAVGSSACSVPQVSKRCLVTFQSLQFAYCYWLMQLVDQSTQSRHGKGLLCCRFSVVKQKQPSIIIDRLGTSFYALPLPADVKNKDLKALLPVDSPHDSSDRDSQCSLQDDQVRLSCH